MSSRRRSSARWYAGTASSRGVRTPIALAETQGPQAGLALLATLDGDERIARHHRLLSVRAHLLEKTGDSAGAYEHYQRAAKATASIAEQRYLRSRASRLRTQA